MAEGDDKPEVYASKASIVAGGVEVSLDGPGVTSSEAYQIWQKVYDTVTNGRNRIGSGSGFVGDVAEIPGQIPFSYEAPPEVNPVRPDWQSGFALKPPIEFREAPAFGSAEAKKKDCFHPWAGCNC